MSQAVSPADLEDVFFSVPICSLRFDFTDPEDPGTHDVQIDMAIKADRLKLLTALKTLRTASVQEVDRG